jgi:3-mercaptopyruvate sulfurtransferase SseA
MNKRINFRTALTMIFALAGFSLPACNTKSGNVQTSERSPVPQQSEAAPALPTDGVRRITILELRDALEKGEAIAVDVRGEVEYKLGHIKGARSVPLGLISQQSGDLPKDKLIVTYCA